MSNRNNDSKIQVTQEGLSQKLSLQIGGREIAQARVNLDPSPDLIPAALRESRVGIVEEIELAHKADLNQALIKEIYKVARTEHLEYLVILNHESQSQSLLNGGFTEWNDLLVLQLDNEQELIERKSFLADLCRFYNGMERLSRFFQPMPTPFDAFDFTGAAI